MKEKTMGANREHSGKEQLFVTPGSILTPVLMFRGPSVTSVPPKPEARGFTNKPGDGPIPMGKSKTAGANRALGAFGLNKSGKGDE